MLPWGKQIMKLGGRRVEEGSGEQTNGNCQPSFISKKETSLSPIAKLLRGHRRCRGERANLFFFISLHTFICCISFGRSVKYWRFLPSTTATQLKYQSYEPFRGVWWIHPLTKDVVKSIGTTWVQPGAFLFHFTAACSFAPSLATKFTPEPPFHISTSSI